MFFKYCFIIVSCFVSIPILAFIHDHQSVHNYSSLYLYSDHFYYEEFHNNETIMSEKGRFNGLNLAYQFPLKNNWLLKVSATSLRGNTTYTGSLQSLFSNETTPFSINNIVQTRHVYAAYLANRYNANDQTTLISFTGIYYRKWIDRLDLASIYGYKRATRYLTLPVGIHYQYQVNDFLKVGASGTYHIWVNGKNTSGLGRFGDTQNSDSSIIAHQTDLSFEQNSGNGLECSLFLRYQFKNNPLMLDISFNYTKWIVDDSDPEGLYFTNIDTEEYYFRPEIYFEPKNVSIQKGISIGLHRPF